MKAVLAIDRFLVRIEHAALVIFFSVMVVLAFTQVILRNLFDTGFLWADPLIRHLVIWVGFIGAAIATHDDRHIAIDALTKFIPARGKAIAKIGTALFAIVVCYYLSAAALTFLLAEKDAGGEMFLSVPTWVGLIIIPAGYGLIAIHSIVKIVEHVFVVVKKKGVR